MKGLYLLVPITLLFFLGLVMIFDTSSAEVLDWHLKKHTWQDLIKQMCYALVACGFGYGVYSWGFSKFLNYSPQLLALSTLLLIATFIPGIGREVNGSHRWITLGPVTIQPSEFAKYVISAFFIHWWLKSSRTFKDYLILLLILSIPILLILKEPNNGTAAVIVMTLLVLSFLARISYRYWGIPVAFAMVAAVASFATVPYVQARIHAYLHPEHDLKGKGHQPYQAKIAAGSGQLFGKGPGNSLQKLSYLPEAQNDYIAAIYAEEFGFVGIFFLIALYLTFLTGASSIVLSQKELAPFLLSASILFLISFQAFLNLGVVSGLLPSTGLNLPFFSQGGSSLVANAGGIGLLLNIYKNRLSWVKES